MGAPEDPTLAEELATRAEADKAARRQAERRATQDGICRDQDVCLRISQIDQENTAWIKDVLARRGWPGRRLVGGDGAEAAWLLCQHADHDPALQRRALALLESAVSVGDAEARQLAYLTDRVLSAEGRPQRYGTQFHPGAGQLAPRPIEEADSLDERRAAMELCPFDEYVDSFRRRFR